MGEIADDVLSGAICEQCGEYLGEETGYPRTCSSCQIENQEPIIEED